ncbi:uncharacterized protein AB675_1802 [Cyphellophora attinorum]|uniref:Alpha/beta hydrolase fold-3 domain-containing protein n=1 Tax=Cyphellophora attinorum TaxID=1664694 RepID=A0A0N0NPS3_9EURO|nr:uncharacterized protein AB675_1802 [Phialophora attinorum]KPI42879.1 hypothetical protein AB675_1802 [Phialophora attinorum]
MTDALTLSRFALERAGIPPDRIVVFAQSIGAAVAMLLCHQLALGSPPTLFADMVLAAPFADVELLTWAQRGVNKFIVNKWASKGTLASFNRHCDVGPKSRATSTRSRYDITLIHAEDDYDIPWVHSDVLF